MFKLSLNYRNWKQILTRPRYRFRFDSHHQLQPSLKPTYIISKTSWRFARGVTPAPEGVSDFNVMQSGEQYLEMYCIRLESKPSVEVFVTRQFTVIKFSQQMFPVYVVGNRVCSYLHFMSIRIALVNINTRKNCNYLRLRFVHITTLKLIRNKCNKKNSFNQNIRWSIYVGQNKF